MRAARSTLSGERALTTTTAVFAQLDIWQVLASALTMRCAVPAFDNKLVNLNPVTLVPQEWDPESTDYVGELVLSEV